MRRPARLLTPVRMRAFNGVSAVFWLVMTPVALIDGWASSVTFVAILSLWALVAASIAGFVASRVEVAQDEADIPGEVVARIVLETEVEILEDLTGDDGAT